MGCCFGRMPRYGGDTLLGHPAVGPGCGCCCKEGVRVGGGKASRCGAALPRGAIQMCTDAPCGVQPGRGWGGVWVSGSTLRGVPRCAVPARLALQMWGLLTTSRCGAVPGSEGATFGRCPDVLPPRGRPDVGRRPRAHSRCAPGATWMQGAPPKMPPKFGDPPGWVVLIRGGDACVCAHAARLPPVQSGDSSSRLRMGVWRRQAVNPTAL